MTDRILAIIKIELLVLIRNKWVVVSAALMIGFSLLIAVAGSSPVGQLGVDRLTVTAASLSTLAVYLVPLIALLISYDAIAGETSRGTLALLLTYPSSRFEILGGKLLAQFAVLSGAIVLGIGAATAVLAAIGESGSGSLAHIVRLGWSACLLGAVFLAVGNLVSASTREPGTAAALAIAIWIVAVVMYDVALLAALVGDDGGFFTRQIFPWLLIASPTDAFRLFNLTQIDPGAISGGISNASRYPELPGTFALASLILWPLLAAACAAAMLKRYTP